MKRSYHCIALCTALILGCASMANAHVISVEPQALEKDPKKALDGDFTVDNPFNIGWIDGAPINESQAVFAYLTKGDVDFYELTITEDEKGTIISASALPPACEQTVNDYPVSALLYKPAPAYFYYVQPIEDVVLPFDVPVGYSLVAYADNPEISYEDERPIFDIDSEMADPELELGLSWFLPEGLSMTCMFVTPWTCDYTNTIGHYAFPGNYLIAMWDTKGKKMDYTANIGFKESSLDVPGQSDMHDLVRDNALLHSLCTDPYSDEDEQ